MVDVTVAPSQRLSFLNEEINRLQAAHLYQELRVLNGKQDVECVINGKKVINFSSNNYLGLTNHPALIKAAKDAIDTHGVGTASVRTIIGTMDIHQELEEKLAEFKHTEATLVLQSGFMANTAAITSILGDGDVIISDALNHASIIDACRVLKQVPTLVYTHKDMNHLEDRLKEAKTYNRKLIVTDGVFSMDGDIAPLPEIVALAEQYNAVVMVDDAHSSGVLGKNGRGSVNHFGLDGRVDIQVGTLSKAIGAMGGYVAGPKVLRKILINKARPFLFSTSHPPSVVMSCMAAIQVLETDTTLIDRLWSNTRYFKEGMQRIGFQADSETPIVPVIAGSSEKAQQLSRRLFEEGIYGQAIVFPTVARDKARIRVIVTASHTQAHLDQAIDTFEKLGKELGIL
jgi:glycine C-acetyltransferase